MKATMKEIKEIAKKYGYDVQDLVDVVNDESCYGIVDAQTLEDMILNNDLY